MPGLGGPMLQSGLPMLGAWEPMPGAWSRCRGLGWRCRGAAKSFCWRRGGERLGGGEVAREGVWAAAAMARSTSKMCTLEQPDFARPWWSLPWNKPPAVVPPSGPRPWKSSGSRRASVLPLPSHVLTATLFISVLAASLTFFGFALRTAKRIEPFGVASQSFILLGRSGSSSSSSSYSGNLIAYIILSNIPQLVISICHLRLNAVLTRLCVAKEWHEMIIAYRPLRTTEPKGEQTGRYTLQMPLAWAVPSILLSIVFPFLGGEFVVRVCFERGVFDLGRCW